MAYLVASLRSLFNELDATWPHRDHGLDGWIGDAAHCPGTSDHCADSLGRVHAIDIDKDGIDPNYVVSRLIRHRGIVRYVNWSYKQYHVNYDYAPRNLGGNDPHTNHIHVSIEHTDTARNYVGGYGIYMVNGIPSVNIPTISLAPQNNFDESDIIFDSAGILGNAAVYQASVSSAIEGLRI